ncbi:MAG: phosphoribosylaminoimidazolesuccinocarboxamide synthase [Elusimicrobia bacterium]|nr:phosphoribosylaminoimidazolesuccinocarboxamide synthase [Elusimicrobiota bacterium]
MGVTFTANTLLRSEIPGLKLLSRGKVRDVYDLNERLLIVATDRISAFDCVLPTPIPGKGALLNALSAFWFRKTGDVVPNHLITTDFAEILRALPPDVRLDPELYDRRLLLARKARRVDAECIVRGCLAGSGWKEYCEKGTLCGERLPQGLQEASPLPRPVFTPSTKAASGHDENISRERLSELAGADIAREIERLSLMLYDFASRHAQERGLILADTKFEFGFINDRLCVIDEMLTPDSSRFWDQSAFKPGASPANFDKQFVRDWLDQSAWDKRPPAPELPPAVVDGTARRYREAFRRLTR